MRSSLRSTPSAIERTKTFAHDVSVRGGVGCSGQEPCLIETRRSAVSGRLRVAKMPRIDANDSVYYEELSDATVLLIGSASDCVHSVYRPDTVLTKGYWDVFGVLPALIPQSGVIGIYGLAAGTIPRLINHFYPQRKMIGWEIDREVVALGRRHMDLDLLEKNGSLEVIIGDCFTEMATIPDGFAGLIVDVFLDNAVHPLLSQADVWEMFQSRLCPGGRLIANIDPQELRHMSAAFEGDLQWHVHPVSRNMAVLSGPYPSAEQWNAVPSDLRALGCCQGWDREPSSLYGTTISSRFGIQHHHVASRRFQYLGCRSSTSHSATCRRSLRSAPPASASRVVDEGWVQAVAPVTRVKQAGVALLGAALLATASPAFANELLEIGEDVFTGNCAACHAGGLNSVEETKTLFKKAIEDNLAGGYNEAAIEYQVRNGKGAMPAWEGRLDDEEIQAVVKYVYTQADGGW